MHKKGVSILKKHTWMTEKRMQVSKGEHLLMLCLCVVAIGLSVSL